MIKFEDLCEDIPEESKGVLDRENYLEYINSYNQRTITSPDFLKLYMKEFAENGVTIFDPFVLADEKSIDNYCNRFIKDRPPGKSFPTWRWDVPFMEIPEVRDLCLNPLLMDVINALIGSEMALNLNLIGWTSTERNFHVDSYLNPSCIGMNYLAVWFALADIHPDSGVFEYVPGSHKWPTITRDKTFAVAPPEMRSLPTWNADWPAMTETFVVPACEAKIAQEGLPIKQFIPKKGEVLIWHANLMHRGSVPKVRGLERRALIAHYSSIKHRLDMPNVAQHKTGYGRYFVL